MVIVTAVALAVVGPARAQEAEPPTETRVVTIVNADSVSGSVVDGERLRTLVGNVHLVQDSTDLRARRATQFLDRDEILFEGAVEIADDLDTLNARRVTYDSKTRVGRAEGDVRLADDEAELFSNSVTYYRSAKRAEFTEPVRLVEREGGAVLTSARGTYLTGSKEAFFEDDVQLVDSVTVLTSERGRYGTEDQRADFFGTVRLQHPSTRLEADTLVHFRDTGISRARGGVLVERFGDRDEPGATTMAPADSAAMPADSAGVLPDSVGAPADSVPALADRVPPDSTRRTLLFGGEVFHDEPARYSRVEIEPLLLRLQADSTGATDTLIVRARVLEASQPDSLEGRAPPPGGTFQRLVARDDVRLFGPSLAAVADSAVFDRLDFDSTRAEPVRDEVRLFRDPVGWLNARGSAVFTEISGDSIRATARDEAVDSVRVLGRAFAARPDSVLGRINQIRGRQMLALFAQDSLRWMKVWPAAEAVYFRADEDDALEGAVRFSADSLAFRFDGDELERVQGVRGVEGVYYDAGLVPEPLRLDGFRYAPERRPTRARLLADNPLERRRERPEPPNDPAAAEPAPPPPVPHDVPPETVHDAAAERDA